MVGDSGRFRTGMPRNPTVMGIFLKQLKIKRITRYRRSHFPFWNVRSRPIFQIENALEFPKLFPLSHLPTAVKFGTPRVLEEDTPKIRKEEGVAKRCSGQMKQ